jgi:hypothetical protein
MAAMYVAMLLTDWQIIKHTSDPSDPADGDQNIYVRSVTCIQYPRLKQYPYLDWSLGCSHVDAHRIQLDQRDSVFLEFVGPHCDA